MKQHKTLGIRKSLRYVKNLSQNKPQNTDISGDLDSVKPAVQIEINRLNYLRKNVFYIFYSSCSLRFQRSEIFLDVFIIKKL